MFGERHERAKAVLAEPGVLILRYGSFERFVLPGFIVFAFGWIGVYEFTLGDLGDAVGGVAFLGLAGLIVWLMTFRTIVAVGRDAMVIRNPLRTVVVDLDDIASLTPEYEGLVVRTTQGKKMTAVAIQRWNLTLFFRRRSRADDAVDLILERQRARHLPAN